MVHPHDVSRQTARHSERWIDDRLDRAMRSSAMTWRKGSSFAAGFAELWLAEGRADRSAPRRSAHSDSCTSLRRWRPDRAASFPRRLRSRSGGVGRSLELRSGRGAWPASWAESRRLPEGSSPSRRVSHSWPADRGRDHATVGRDDEGRRNALGQKDAGKRVGVEDRHRPVLVAHIAVGRSRSARRSPRRRTRCSCLEARFARKPGDRRHLGDAGGAPRRPDVQEHGLAFELR